jgi:hypothetical protein
MTFHEDIDHYLFLYIKPNIIYFFIIRRIHEDTIIRTISRGLSSKLFLLVGDIKATDILRITHSLKLSRTDFGEMSLYGD